MDSETKKKNPNEPSNLDLIHVYRVHGFDHFEIEVYASTMKIKSGKLELEQYLQRSSSLFLYQKLAPGCSKTKDKKIKSPIVESEAKLEIKEVLNKAGIVLGPGISLEKSQPGIDTEHSSISRDILLCSVSIGHGHLYIWTELLSKLGVFLALVDLKC